MNGIQDDAQEYITKTEDRLKSKLTPSKSTKNSILDHAGEIQTPEEWWNTQDNKNTEMDVSSRVCDPSDLLYTILLYNEYSYSMIIINSIQFTAWNQHHC